MEIDVTDGYRKNPWAKFKNPLRKASSGAFNTPNVVNFRGNERFDDLVLQQDVSRGKKMGSNQMLPIHIPIKVPPTIKATKLGVIDGDDSLAAPSAEKNESPEMIKTQTKLVDIYV